MTPQTASPKQVATINRLLFERARTLAGATKVRDDVFLGTAQASNIINDLLDLPAAPPTDGQLSRIQGLIHSIRQADPSRDEIVMPPATDRSHANNQIRSLMRQLRAMSLDAERAAGSLSANDLAPAAA